MGPTQAYQLQATGQTRALIIYLIDVGASMAELLGEKRRIDVATDALEASLREMVFRSTKGAKVASRYNIAMCAYSSTVWDLLDGVAPLDYVAQLGVPQLATMSSSEAALGFEYVEKLLQEEIPKLQDCPAPLVCHITDGEYTGEDPEPIVRRIMQMAVPDGHVLVENIFVSDSIISEPVSSPQDWVGISFSTNVKTEYARKLRSMSSQLPESYREIMADAGNTRIVSDAVMMWPGLIPELVATSIVTSASTPVASRPRARTESRFKSSRGDETRFRIEQPVVSSQASNSTKTASEPNARNLVFVSYSHKDARWLQRLQVHLRPLQRLGTITLWDDTKIRPGSNWREEIMKGVNSARAAVLLVSADFLASDFITTDELPPLLLAAEKEGAVILPIILSPCWFERTPSLSQFQAVNAPSRPLANMSRGRQEEVFVRVAEAVANALHPGE